MMTGIIKTPKPILKTLDQIDGEYIESQSSAQTFSGSSAAKYQRTNKKPSQADDSSQPEAAIDTPTAKRRRIRSRISGAIFYTVLIVFVIGAFLLSKSGTTTGAPRDICGFSAMRVLTKSMQSEIPKDSLVITRYVNTNSLKIGDDITYLKNDKTTVTHRIIGIYESYADTGKCGFQTQGVMNPSPDKEIVAAQNIVGKVVFHSVFLGRMVTFIKSNVLYIGIFTALLAGFIFAMRVFLTAKKKKGETENTYREKHAINT